MKKLVLLCFAFLILCAPLYADVYSSPAKLEYIVKNLPKLSSIKCSFIQEKRMANLKKPVKSSGEFEYVENKGVYFHTTKPVELKTDYTDKNYKQINDVVKAISEKKYRKIEKEFNFYYEGNINNWTLGLKPKKDAASYKYIKNITVSGRDYIDRIEICQTNGNVTSLWFIK